MIGPDGRAHGRTDRQRPPLRQPRRRAAATLHRRPAGTLRVIALPAPVAQAIGVDSLQTVGLELGARRLTALMGAKLDAGDIGALVRQPSRDRAAGLCAGDRQACGAGSRASSCALSQATSTRCAPSSTRSRRGQPLNVEPADFDAQLFASAAAPANQSEELFSAISALVGFMFAFNAMLVTAHLRRSLVETLRRRGATRMMTVQVLLFDALVLGVLGTLLGLALGEPLSMLVFRADPGYLAFAFAVGAQRIVDLAERRAGGRGRSAGRLRRRPGPPAQTSSRSRLRAAPGRNPGAPRRRGRRYRRPRAPRPAVGAGLPGDHHDDPARASPVRDPRQRHARCGAAVAAAARLRRDRSPASRRSSVRSTRPRHASRSSNCAHPTTACARWRSPRPGASRYSAASRSRERRSNLQRGLDASARTDRLQRRRVGEPAGRGQHVHDHSLRRHRGSRRSPACRA